MNKNGEKMKGSFIPPKKEGEVGLFIHDIEHGFKGGDKIVDITAEKNNWPDMTGEIVEIDGTNIKVRYASGNERWKMSINLRKAD